MAEQQRNARPSARVLFIVPEGGRPKGDQEGGGFEDRLVEVAAAWKTDKGNLRFKLDSIPAPLLAGQSVTFVVVYNDEPEASSSNRGPQRGGRR